MLSLVWDNHYVVFSTLSSLHRTEPPSSNVSVHLSNLACQTGVSRFTQLNAGWNYDKTEGLSFADKGSFRLEREYKRSSRNGADIERALN